MRELRALSSVPGHSIEVGQSQISECSLADYYFINFINLSHCTHDTFRLSGMAWQFVSIAATCLIAPFEELRVGERERNRGRAAEPAVCPSGALPVSLASLLSFLDFSHRSVVASVRVGKAKWESQG